MSFSYVPCLPNCNTLKHFLDNIFKGELSIQYINHKQTHISMTVAHWVTKGKATPVQVWTNPLGTWRLRLPEFLDNHYFSFITVIKAYPQSSEHSPFHHLPYETHCQWRRSTICEYYFSSRFSLSRLQSA